MLARKNPTKPKQEKSTSRDDAFTLLIKSQFNVNAVKEFRFHPERMWRFDYCIPSLFIALESEGGVFKETTYIDKKTGKLITRIGGRHNTAKGFLDDMEKYNAAATLGWVVVRTTADSLYSSKTLELVRKCIEMRKNLHKMLP